MTSVTAPNSGSNNGRTSAITAEKVRSWERDLLEALRAARHQIDWGTGSVMDDKDPPPMIKNKMEAHGAITEAEEFLEKITDALSDFISERDNAARREARADVVAALGDRARVEALAREVHKLGAAAVRMLALLGEFKSPYPPLTPEE